MATIFHTPCAAFQEKNGLQRKQQVYNGELGISLPSGFGSGSNFPAINSDTQTTFSLAGLHPNHETVASYVKVNALPTGKSFTRSSTWQRPGGATFFSVVQSFSTPPPTGGFVDTWWASWVGWAPTFSEITVGGTHTIIETVTGGVSLFSSKTFDITNFTSASSHQLPASATAGHIWDEGGTIAFLDSDRIKHQILTTNFTSAPGVEDGYFWMDSSQGISKAKLGLTHSGNAKRTNRTSLPDNFFPGVTGTPGYIFVSAQRRGMLSFIGHDGKRYAMTDGYWGDL